MSKKLQNEAKQNFVSLYFHRISCIMSKKLQNEVKRNKILFNEVKQLIEAL